MLKSLFNWLKLHAVHMSNRGLGFWLNRVAICLSPFAAEVLPQLWLGHKNGDYRWKEWEGKRGKKCLKNFQRQYFYKWMINIWPQLGRGSMGALCRWQITYVLKCFTDPIHTSYSQNQWPVLIKLCTQACWPSDKCTKTLAIYLLSLKTNNKQTVWLSARRSEEQFSG